MIVVRWSLFAALLATGPWRAIPADGVEMHLSQAGSTLRIDFDFHGHGGYAIARRELPIDLPENFEFTFRIRGEAPRNTLEFKLIDTTGENVWWTTKREFDFPRDWKRIAIRKSQLAFAWGPLGGGDVPRRIGALEIVVTAGTGGKGTVWIDDLELSPIVSTSELPPPFGPFRRKVVTIDLEQRREFGGMTLDWDRPVDYTVSISRDGKEWEAVRRVRGGRYVDAPDADARFIRISLDKLATLKKVTLHPVAWSKTPNDFLASIASDSKRGDWPRYLYGEQSYWTIVGADASPVEALVSEDGAVELGNARCSLEPFFAPLRATLPEGEGRDVLLNLPEAKIADSVRSNLAFILINRDGPAIQPGSRSYERSWIRDGSLTSTALLRLGHHDEVRDFINWYAQFQDADGKIPCCVGSAGADPVPEHDSHGEFIYLIAEYYRHTHDRALVESLWPRIEKTVAYIDSLRQQRMTKQYEGTVFYGLVPESISHEGYSAKPMHSYWDDFFILRGLKDAAFLASELGKTRSYAAMRDEFEKNLLTSITLSVEQHHIDYIPGAAELGDFDATSTTIALEPVGEADKLPHDPLLRTFDKYFEHAL